MALRATPPKLLSSSPRNFQAHDGGAVEAAQFLSGNLTDLAVIARRHRLDTLGYLLDMAKMEADEIARGRSK